MVGWLRQSDEWFWRPRAAQVRVMDLPLLALTLPRGGRDRRLKQGARVLRKSGVRRVLLSPELVGADLTRYGLQAVDPLPLCRAKANDLVLTLLKGVPRRERRVALRGEWAGEALDLADALCNQVGTLILDFDRGEEALAEGLRLGRGTAPFHWGQAAPQVSVEFSPRETAGKTLKLWGEPDLRGLELSLDRDLPADLPALPFLALLWESGRVKIEDIIVGKP